MKGNEHALLGPRHKILDPSLVVIHEIIARNSQSLCIFQRSYVC